MSELPELPELFEGPFDTDSDEHIKAIHLTTLRVLELALKYDASDEEAEAAAEEASDLMTLIVPKGPWALYTSCLSLCRAAYNHVTRQVGEGDGTRMWGFMDVSSEEGEEDPAETFAAQFLVAYMNNDVHGAMALYKVLAEQGPEPAMDGHVALLGQVVMMMTRTEFAKVSAGDALFEELSEKLGLNVTAPDDASALDALTTNDQESETKD